MILVVFGVERDLNFKRNLEGKSCETYRTKTKEKYSIKEELLISADQSKAHYSLNF